MAVSCCAMQCVLKCKMETMNLFIYLLRGRFLPPQLPLLGSCLDASNHLHRLALCDNKSKDPSKTGIAFQLQHRLVLTLPSQHKANLGTFFACFFFFFFLTTWICGWFRDPVLLSLQSFGCFIQYVRHTSTDDTQLHPARFPWCLTARNVLLQQLYPGSGPCWEPLGNFHYLRFH